MASLLFRLALISFVVKTVLKAGTVIPELGYAVFGLRPIIIGFLHLVFLGLVSFYILSEYIRRQVLDTGKALSRNAINGFIVSVVARETILPVQGIGLPGGLSSPLFN